MIWLATQRFLLISRGTHTITIGNQPSARRSPSITAHHLRGPPWEEVKRCALPLSNLHLGGLSLCSADRATLIHDVAPRSRRDKLIRRGRRSRSSLQPIAPTPTPLPRTKEKTLASTH